MKFKIPNTPEELLRQVPQDWERFHPWVPLLATLAVVSAIVFSGFYSVNPDEVGVVCRLGKYARTTQPGLRWMCPLNIENLIRVKGNQVIQEEFGFRTQPASLPKGVTGSPYDEEAYMVTGDLNRLAVTWVVQYQILDPVKFLFQVRSPRDIVRDVSEAAMQQEVGDSTVDETRITRRAEINLAVQKRIQQTLNSYDCGVRIVAVQLQGVRIPGPIKQEKTSLPAGTTGKKP